MYVYALIQSMLDLCPTDDVHLLRDIRMSSVNRVSDNRKLGAYLVGGLLASVIVLYGETRSLMRGSVVSEFPVERVDKRRTPSSPSLILVMIPVEWVTLSE